MTIFQNQNSAQDEKRAAPRYTARLSAPVIITVVSNTADNTESYLILQGRLKDVSRTGVGLIISDADLQEFYQLKNDFFFRLLLPLPVKAIELEVIPVRYKQLKRGERSETLIGANIINMNGRDRIIFMEFINQFEQMEPMQIKSKPILVIDFDPHKTIGMDIYTAFVWVKQYGHSIRVIRKNGNNCLVPRNYYPNRIDVATQEDVIVEILGLS